MFSQPRSDPRPPSTPSSKLFLFLRGEYDEAFQAGYPTISEALALREQHSLSGNRKAADVPAEITDFLLVGYPASPCRPSLPRAGQAGSAGRGNVRLLQA